MDAYVKDRGHVLLRSNPPKPDTGDTKALKQGSNQSCKTLKLVAKHISSNVGKLGLQSSKQTTSKDLDKFKGQSAGGSLAGDRRLLEPREKRDSNADISERFFESDTYRCIMKERETIDFVKRVRNEVDSEIGHRVDACKQLKERLEHLVYQERQLLMAIEGQMVQNDLDLEVIQ